MSSSGLVAIIPVVSHGEYVDTAQAPLNATSNQGLHGLFTEI